MKKIYYLFLLFCIVSVIIQPVSAYWDIGTGTLIWQAIAALGLAVLYALKIKWQYLKNILQKK